MSEETPHRTGARLTPLTVEPLPWRRAQTLQRCFLCWIPVDGFPIPSHQREWLMTFMDQFRLLLKEQFGLRPEVFLQKTVVEEMTERFVNKAMEFTPKLGFSLRPGAPFPSLPSKKDVDGLVEQAKRREKIDLDKWAPQSCYWFSSKAERQQREDFFGHGGMTITFLKPDPATTPPVLPFSPELMKKNELLRMANFDGMLANAFALKDSFLEKSKQLFGDPARKDDLMFRGLRFILPALTTADFFSQPQELVEKWFQVFDVYISESPADKGVLLASSLDLETMLIDLLKKLEDQGLTYEAR